MKSNNPNSSNKKRKIEKYSNIFVLNTNNIDKYLETDPDELIIINSSNDYSNSFNQIIWNGGIKIQVKKIITSDSIITKYFNMGFYEFSQIFPNCTSIQINSLDNNYRTIPTIINNFKIIKNLEYVLDDNVYINNAISNYKNFFETFFSQELKNIEHVKIINKIDLFKSKCVIEKNIIMNLIDIDVINEFNKTQFDFINNFKIRNNHIHYIPFEYINMSTNTNIRTQVINID